MSEFSLCLFLWEFFSIFWMGLIFRTILRHSKIKQKAQISDIPPYPTYAQPPPLWTFPTREVHLSVCFPIASQDYESTRSDLLKALPSSWVITNQMAVFTDKLQILSDHFTNLLPCLHLFSIWWWTHYNPHICTYTL